MANQDKLPTFIDPFAPQAEAETELPKFVDPFEASGEDWLKNGPMAGTEADERGFVEGLKEAGSTVGSIARGVANAPISIAGGVAETGALIIDTALGTNTAEKVEDTVSAIKNVTGSKTRAGQIADDVASFGASFLMPALWVSKATSVARGLQTGKGLMGWTPKTGLGRKLDDFAVAFGKSDAGKKLLAPRPLGLSAGAYGATAVGTFATSALVSPSGRSTFADNVDWMPDLTQTDQERVQGADETTRRWSNKFKNASEDAAFGLAFDTVLGVGMEVGKAAGRGAGAALKSETARPVVEAVSNTAKRVYDAGLKDSMAENFVKRNLTASKGLDPKYASELEMTEGLGKSIDRETYKIAKEFDLAARKMLQQSLKTSDGSTLTMARIHKDVEDIFSGKATVDDFDYMSPELKKSIGRVQVTDAKGVDDLISVIEEEIKIAPTGSRRKEIAEEALAHIQQGRKNNIVHLRRLYQRYEDPDAFFKQLDLDGEDFTQTVDDMVEYMDFNKSFVPDATAEQRRSIAEDEVRTMLGLASRSSGLSNKELIKKARNELRLAKDINKDGILVARIPKLKQNADILESRTKFMDKSEAAKRLLGIIDDDPLQTWRQGMNHTANLVATRDYYRNIPTVSLDQARQMLQQGGRPLVVRGPDDEFFEGYAAAQRVGPGQPGYVEGLAPELQKTVGDVVKEEMKDLTGYVKLGESTADQAFGGQFGELTGLYVAPEYYASVTMPYALKNIGFDAVASLFQAARAASQKVTVVPSITANARQLYGNMMMLGSNANLGADNVSLALRTQLATLEELNDEGLARTARKLSIAGVADENVILETLKEYRKRGQEFSGLEAVQRLFDKAGDALGMKYFEKFYSGTDTVAKAAALFGEEAKIGAVFKQAGISDINPAFFDAFKENKLFSGAQMQAGGETGKRQLFENLTPTEVMAAEVVKDTMPTYSRIVQAAKFVDKVPIVGNFTSFAAENTRNAFNTVARGMREMAFEVSPEVRQRLLSRGYTEEQIQAVEKGIRGIGGQRIAAFTAVNAILPKQLVKMSLHANGLSEEQYQAIKETAVADYLKEAGHDIMILDTYGPGRYQAIDLSYTFPYAYLTDVGQAALDTYRQQGKLGKSDVEAGAAAALNGLMRFGEPFSQETMVFERLMDVMPEGVPGARGGKTRAQGTIYGRIDDGWTKARKSAQHVLGGFTPEFTRMIITEKNGDIVPGRISKTVLGLESRQGVQGKYHDPFVEGMRLVSGFTPMEIDARTSLEFAGKEYSGNRSEVRNAAIKVLGDMEAGESKIIDRWDDYLDALYKEQSRLYFEVQNLRKIMGDSPETEKEIQKQLVRDAKIGQKEAAQIMAGRFQPAMATIDTIAAMNQELRDEGGVRRTQVLPIREMNRMAKEMANKELIFVDPATQNLPEFIDPFDQAPAPQPEAPAQLPAFIDPFDQGSLPTAPAPVQTAAAKVNPILLGDSPATQALAKSLGRSQ